GSVAARHANAGQVCTSAERVFVHQEIAEEFTSRYVDAVSALSVGAPSAEGTDIGPLASSAQLAKVRAAVAAAREDGAEILLDGSAADASFGAGYWVSPTVVAGGAPEMRGLGAEPLPPA